MYLSQNFARVFKCLGVKYFGNSKLASSLHHFLLGLVVNRDRPWGDSSH